MGTDAQSGAAASPRYRLLIVASHVIQYQAPFFRLLAREADIDLTVAYCSRAGLDVYRDEDMKTSLAWDVDLLGGYSSMFMRNFGWGDGYLRLLNPVLPAVISRGRYDAVIFFTGWGSLSALLGIAACRASGTPAFLYGDSSHPPPVAGWKGRIRESMLRAIFRNVSGFMVSGHLNAEYYAHYGADRARFFLLPWAIDNERFSNVPAGTAAATRAALDIDARDFVVVFSAKLVARKDPLTLVRAVGRMHRRERTTILFLGDGELRPDLEALAARLDVKAVFAGFVNQSALPAHYATGDVFVLPSTYEPRGAVVNEAMAVGLPVIVTDRCGSIGDIVREGENAFVYPASDAAALASYLDRLAEDEPLRRDMSAHSRRIMSTWNFERGVAGVRKMLESVPRGKRR